MDMDSECWLLVVITMYIKAVTVENQDPESVDLLQPGISCAL